jgi:hypothetical protein
MTNTIVDNNKQLEDYAKYIVEIAFSNNKIKDLWKWSACQRARFLDKANPSFGYNAETNEFYIRKNLKKISQTVN